jgi:hypothetical protein
VVAGDVIDFYAFAHPIDYFVYYLHVGFGPIPFAELPHINNVPIEHYHFGFDAVHVVQ